MMGEASSGRASRRTHAAIAAVLAVALAVPALAWAAPSTPLVDPTVPAKRDTEPVVLTGASFGEWSSNSDASVKLPLTDLIGCPSTDDQVPHNPPRDNCAHNNYAAPEVDSGGRTLRPGVPVDRLLGYRWDDKAGQWRQIPFQVDEMFTRYLDNSASGFALYSGQDQHTTYAFDREGFRFTQSDPNNPCLARAPDGVGTTADPVKGLDSNDELAFMASDAGAAAPSGTPLPQGIEGSRAVAVADPLKPGAPTIVYVMLAAANGPRPQFDASNGYVHYARDPNADFFERSVSSYDSYGNAARGTICDAQGHPIGEDKRRPRDYATVKTDRYSFRYDGRWLMTGIRVSPDGGSTFGPNLVDRWKARAFQQDPSSNTPCCGYEEEDTNWGGSSTLMGERVGPVRTIRETWGADSGTNVVRRETFYRGEVRQKSWLRVHVIPPLDGIYAQWDFKAGVMKRYLNPHTATSAPGGSVKIDGYNDEIFGNLDDPCNENYNANDTSQLDQGYRTLYRSIQLCDSRLKDPRESDPGPTYHQSVDIADPTFSSANASLAWSQTSGPDGTIVDRYQVDRVTDLTPGGAAQSVVAVPYYRDDSCFDDGTGTDPGPKLHLRSGDEPRDFAGAPRRCWHPQDGSPDGSARFYQGSIATHGLHLLFLAESDNARQTVPVDEIVAEQRMVMLPGDPGNVGEQYGRGFEKPLVAGVGPAESGKVMLGPPAGGDPGGGGNPGGGNPGGGNPGGGNPGGGGPGGNNPGGGTPGSGSPPGAGSTGTTSQHATVATARAMTARRTRVRRGTFQVRCRVSEPARGCAVTVFAAGRTIGRGAALARPGRLATVTVRLTSAGRRLLARARRGLPARLTARPTGAGAGRSGTSTTLLLG
ncbi:MAG: hypothetical protein QOJ97_857 [Solirubrobacteraceae bacterium]|nr:hypothetical protein [Solirubrobacteraceae bacterium]